MNDAALQRRVIVNERAVEAIRRFIADKHPQMDAGQRAAVLADALHKIIAKGLPDFDPATKVTLRLRLVQTLRPGGAFEMTADDVFGECLKLELDRDDIAKPFVHWVNRQLDDEDDPVSVEALRAYAAEVRQGRSKNASLQQLQSYRQAPGHGFAETAAAAAVPIAPARQRIGPAGMRWLKRSAVVFGFLILTVPAAAIWFNAWASPPVEPVRYPMTVRDIPVFERQAVYVPLDNELPHDYRFKLVDEQSLRDWLGNRNSLMAEDPYFATIIQTAETYNIHPLLMFAITGQENGYVKTTDPNAALIANNPFNVYHSWWEYNTDIEDSARIAAKTILNLSKNRPEDAHPIQWINRKYAEDPNWWKGVNSIFAKLREEVPYREPGIVYTKRLARHIDNDIR